MKTTKKLISILLAVLMFTGCFGLMASAEQYTIDVPVVPPEGGTVGGCGTFDEGTYQVIYATPNDGYFFVGFFRVSDDSYFSNETVAIPNLSSNHYDLYAKFQLIGNLTELPLSSEGLNDGDLYYDLDAAAADYAEPYSSEQYDAVVEEYKSQHVAVFYNPENGLIVIVRRYDERIVNFYYSPEMSGYEDTSSYIKEYKAPDDPTPTPSDNDKPAKTGPACPVCGATEHEIEWIGILHQVFFAVKYLFNNVLYPIFKAIKK